MMLCDGPSDILLYVSSHMRFETKLAIDLADFYVWISLRRGTSIETPDWTLYIGTPMLARAAVISPVSVSPKSGGPPLAGTLRLVAGPTGALPSMTFDSRTRTRAMTAEHLCLEIASLVLAATSEDAA